ncbi:cation:proton antiporter [Chondromyces apiculatus]|uniref:Na+/H+ antiporter n=1 Tax=Chondromyces apiculatus DSM 436 TaxID=1192034 RepID=A0A017SY94_9BACT|nr:sodium:proton antiporter [Chondromyces apiculatus]EYF01276.1 Na+/H+ antiporter [Chondromyces apiculatus DSM 436]
MREHLESLLLVIAVGATVAIGAKRIGVPYNVALVVVGLLLVVLNVLPSTSMDPELILIAFLPVLVFEGALFADADGLRAASRPILALAVPGVAISLLGTAAVATYALDLPFTVALLLGALLSITDTVSVLLAFRSVRVPHRLAAIMEGESLFNDGTALVLVSLTSRAIVTSAFSTSETAKALGMAMLGGVGLGVLFGIMGAAVLRRAPDHLTAILASTVLVFATSLIAERVHASPVIAVVVAGVIVGRAARDALEPSRVLALQGFWETSGFALNVLIFLLVGLQIQASMLIEEATSIALALVALHVGRAIAVYGCFAIMRAVSRERVPMRWQHVMVIGNIKGALSMAAVLSLPATVPFRERLITIVFGVTFVTLMTQALPFERLLLLLKVAFRGAPGAEGLNHAKATLIAARRGQAELDELLAAGLVSRKEHAERRAAFQVRVIKAEEALRGPEGEAARDHVVDLSLLNAQKAALVDAARRGLIDNETASAQVNDIDRTLMEMMHHAPDPHEQ